MNPRAAISQLSRIAVRRRVAGMLGFAGLVLALANPVTGQDATPEKAKQIEYIGPDTYILLDAEGRPQPVPGMTYEDFLAAWKQMKQPAAAERERRYSIESLDVDGEARDGHARLRFTAKVQVLTDEAVDVSLGLLGAILDREPTFGPPAKVRGDSPNDADGADQEIPKQEYVYLNPEHGGFVVHLQGRAGERRDVSLDLIVPLTRDGTETTLPINCPRALSSHIALTVDQPVATAIVNNGTLLPTETTANGGTRLNVAGAMGAVRLTWHAGDPSSAEAATVLSAAGAIRVSIDGRSVRSDARLTVQSYGGSFDRFRVRLPRGAQLVRDVQPTAESQGPAYRVTVEDDSPQTGKTEATNAASRVVLIQLPEKQQSPLIIELSTEQPIGLEAGGPLVELDGFEVLGAVRQYGDVAVEVAGDWQGRWDIGDNVRQVDAGEIDESLQHAGLTAAFQYDRQPWQLGVRITPRQFRVHVAPKYELEILPDEARLVVHLTYQVFGTRAFEFQVALGDWEIADDPIDSGGLVDQDRVQVTPDHTLVLPLAQSSSRRAEIAFTVRRELPREMDRLRLALPVPIADSVGTGELAVIGAADVELLPDLSDSVGLTATPISEATGIAQGSEIPQYHFRTSLPDAVFVAERLHRSREVTVEATADVDLQTSEARIEQQFEYSVRYEPIKELSFQIPAEMPFDVEQTQVVLIAATLPRTESEQMETPLSFVSTDINDDAAGKEGRQLRVVLPQPRIGQFTVRVRYTVSSPEDDWNSGAWLLPLFQPVDGRAGAQHATIRPPRSLAVALDTAAIGSTWKAMLKQEPIDGDQVYEYVAENAESMLPLLVRVVEPNLPSSTIVERVWLQTWLSGDVRQDRAAFRFRTTAPQTTIELPPQLPPGEVEVLVDGQPADLLSRGAGRIVVRAPEERADPGMSDQSDVSLHTLELRYRQPVRRGLIRRHRLTPPQIVGTTALSEVYWQIVLPGDQHLVKSPARMTSTGQWQWLGSFWGRRPLLSQTDLEDWSGASAQLAPATADSEHLFTGLAPVATIEVLTAPRWLIVLAASSAVLTMVLLWTYVPRAQRGWFVVAAAAIVGGLAIAFPAPALLLAQSAALGVAVAAISVLLARLTARPSLQRVAGGVMLSTGSSQRQITPRGDSMLIPPVASAASTAPTASLGMRDSER